LVKLVRKKAELGQHRGDRRQRLGDQRLVDLVLDHEDAITLRDLGNGTAALWAGDVAGRVC
jgi:hypothetical protein